MAETLDEREFWLPSEFLPEDLFVVEKTHVAEAKAAGGGCFPGELPYDWESNQSSPVETVTESDEERVDDLTRRMARSFLCGDRDKSSYPVFSANEGSIACSKQLPLGATGPWSSEVVPSPEPEVSSPQASSPEATLGILLAAAHQMVRKKQEVDASKRASSGVVAGFPREPVPWANTTGQFFANQPLTHREMQINRFYHLKHHQMVKQQKQQLQGSGAWGRQAQVRSGMVGDVIINNSRSRGGSRRPLGGMPTTAWSSPQVHRQEEHSNGSGMRAVFLRTPGSGSRKQSGGGTGVFLPRGVGNRTDSRKKPACSTVLLPAKVVQALNLNLEGVGAQPRFLGGFILDHETTKKTWKKGGGSGGVGGRRLQDTGAGAAHHKVRRDPPWAH